MVLASTARDAQPRAEQSSRQALASPTGGYAFARRQLLSGRPQASGSVFRENKNLWRVMPSNKDSPGFEAIICALAQQNVQQSARGQLFLLFLNLEKVALQRVVPCQILTVILPGFLAHRNPKRTFLKRCFGFPPRPPWMN